MLIIAFAWIVALSGCSRKIVPTISENARDTMWVFDTKRDSIYICDSVFTEIYHKGDTVERLKYVYRTEYRDRVVTDTLWRVRTEEVTRTEKVNELTRWQRTRINLCNYMFVIVFGLLGYWAWRFYKKMK